MPYLTVEETNTLLELLPLQFPSLCERIVLPNLTAEGRTSFALRIRVGPEENRPAVLLLGNVHGEEWGSTDILMSLAQKLLAAAGPQNPLHIGNFTLASSVVVDILQKVEIILFPIVNPDGKAFSQAGDPGWRKNRRPAANPEEIGVDVNRNFDWLWDISRVFDPAVLPPPGASPDALGEIIASEFPINITYHGPAPFSEPESRNVLHLLNDNPRIRFLVDIHGVYGLIMHPWGDDDRQTTDRFQKFDNPLFDGKRGVIGDTAYAEFSTAGDLGRHQDIVHRLATALTAARGTVYEEGPISTTMYRVCGDTADFAYARHRAHRQLPKIDGFLIEWGKQEEGFQPDFHPLMEGHILDVSAALVGLLSVARDQPFVEKTPDPALFGRVAVGEVKSIPITIRNASARPVRISNMHTEGPGYSVPTPLDTRLSPGESVVVAVVLAPQAVGPARGALLFEARFEEIVIGRGLVVGSTADVVEVELQGGNCFALRGECLAPTFPAHGPAACATIRATCALLIALMKLFGGGRFACDIAKLQFRIDHCAEGNGDPCIRLLPFLRPSIPGIRPRT